MSRTVTDLAKLLDVIVGYDPEDPITARGVDQIPDSYTKFLHKNGLQGARIGILRESMGYDAEPGSEDFSKVTAVFDKRRRGAQSCRRCDCRSRRHSKAQRVTRQTCGKLYR